MENTVWQMTEMDRNTRNMASELNISPETAWILLNRGIESKQQAQKFLSPDLRDWNDPYQMKGMEPAVQRIEKAVEDQQNILVFGDYDVDGVLSVVMLMKALSSIGGCVEYFIPDRLKDGYGLKVKHLKMIQNRSIDLVISVDCGIKAVDFTETAKEYGVDVIITDHHLPGPAIPDAVAVLNPALNSSLYPDKKLAGVGVVFKLIQALLEKRNLHSMLSHYLKLVSIGTVADVVPLRGENRIFVKFGLEGLKKASNKGLKQLLSVCDVVGRDVTTGDVGFRIAPRLNAAGRMGQADLSVSLFQAQDAAVSRKIAVQLNKLNSRRQKIETQIFDQAMKKIEKTNLNKKYKFLILGSQEWHRGVIGIVASRLKDLYYRPVVLFSFQNGRAFGSGRSIRDFSLIDCIQNSSRYCISYGGHPLAVGCEIDHKKYDEFRRSMNHYADSNIDEACLRRRIKIDVKIDFTRITSSFLSEMAQLKPHGKGNPRPVFLSKNVSVVSRPRVLKGKHSKFMVKQGGRVFQALGWGRKDWAGCFEKGDWADIVYSLHINQYLGESRLNLVLHDIKPAQKEQQ
ncbi:MAG: single-stranded-DNA-specific exonuclease RecJ [Candidatus Aminicenantes bacterium]|nr:single-stranded-DNA-specific exonuclease RecJ [Candidatus Aminicenantes bacterium]